MEGIKTKLEVMKEFYNDQLYHLEMLKMNAEYLGMRMIEHPNMEPEKRKLDQQVGEQEKIVKFAMEKILAVDASL